MTPCEQFVVDGGELDCAGWDWRAKLPTCSWDALSVRHYKDWGAIGWDVIETDEGPTPPFVMVELAPESGEGETMAHKIAAAVDDKATGLFYTRDWSVSGLPILRDGEPYWSGFWFQRMADAVAFYEEHGGAASWRPDFCGLRDAMREKRSSWYDRGKGND